MTGGLEFAGDPPPGSQLEREAFRALQGRLAGMFARLLPDPRAPRTIVVLPSLSLDPQVMARIKGIHHYEERMLGMLTLLRLPRARVIYLTSRPIPETVIDYYLHFLQGVPSAHARARLTLLCCHDGSLRPLTEKVLERPRLLARLREAVGDPSSAHIVPYAVTPLERTFAVRLGLPVNGCDPDLSALGSKSGGRRIMREAGLSVPDGAEDLADEAQVAEALAALKRRRPDLRRAVVKLNEGFSGEGNALFSFEGAPLDETLEGWAAARLERLAFEAPGMRWRDFRDKIREMGAVVEVFLDGEGKTSPSAQFRVEPSGAPSCVSTHDQRLGGPGGQVFLGCSFPADDAYRALIAAEGEKVARVLAQRGVLGRFGVDFLCLREEGEWRAYAIEINLRKGGTTHPFLMLEFLTDGVLDEETGLFLTRLGHPRYYVASDNLESERYRGLTPHDLVDLIVLEGLHFDGSVQEGVVFHLIGALSEFGKLGVVCVGASPERAQALYERTQAILERAQATA